MNQFAGLLLDGGDHIGMAMAGGSHGDAGGEIEELVAVDVFDDDAASALGHQRVGARVGRRQVFVIACDDAFGIGARNGGRQLGAGSQSLRGHGILRILSQLSVLSSGSQWWSPADTIRIGLRGRAKG